MPKYLINDLEKISGIKAHTIRMWEKRYNLFVPERTDSNIRCYSDNDVKKILNISILNKFGYKISEIAKLNSTELAERVMNVSQNHPDITIEIENLIVSMIEFDEAKFEKCFSRSILKLGFEDTFIQIITPFYRKVGTMWQVGAILPGHEHFASNLIRNKLIAAIDNINTLNNENAKTFLLFLPEMEMHELGMLYYYYYLKKKGHKVIYLGQSVPLADIVEIAKKIQPDFLLASFVTSLTKIEYENSVQFLASNLPMFNILLTGLQATSNMIKLPLSICVISSEELTFF